MYTSSQQMLSPGFEGFSATGNLAGAISTMSLGNTEQVFQKDIHGFYKFLFENDLKSARERTLNQLNSIKTINDENREEHNELQHKNIQLKSYIKRYKIMVDELLGKDGKNSELSKFQANKKSNEDLNLDFINNQLYKYGDNQKKGADDTRSSFFGNLTAQTPGTNLNYRTNMSFAGGRAPHYNLDLKKAEQITNTMPQIFKCAKVLESIILMLQMMKDVFKAQKITLFIVDTDLQRNIFINKNEKKQNYKKLIVGGSDLVYGLFTVESDFCGPLFKDVS